MTYPNSQFLNTTSSGGTSTAPFITIFKTRDPNPYDIGYPISQRWLNKTNTTNPTEWILVGFTSTNGVVLAQWGQVGSNAFDLQTLTGNSGGAIGSDSMHNINILGAAGQISVTGSPGTNTLTIGLIGGSAAIEQLKPNVGSNVLPSGGVVNVNSSTSTYTDGNTANTLKIEIQGTNHALFVGRGSTTPATTLGPGSSGQPLVSAGASADPAFGTLTVPGGGTGDTSFTAYSVICGGTSSTGNLQSVASVGSAGQVLTSNGAGALPTFQANRATAGVNIQVFTTSGTYTPTPGMVYCIIEAVGGGGGGSGGAAGGNTTVGALLTCNGGSAGAFGGTSQPPSNGGTSSGGNVNITGGQGGGVHTGAGVFSPGNGGGNSFFGGAGGANGGNASDNSGSGGGGGQLTTDFTARSGGAAGGYARLIASAATIGGSQVITIGAGGAGANSGGNGAAGIVIITEYL